MRTLCFALLLLGTIGKSVSSVSDFAEPQKVDTTDPLLWGPYKPNLYLGLRPRIPKSISAGLLWSQAEDFGTFQENVRHTCEQSNGMAGYGWDAYDPRLGGVQTIHDTGNQMDLTTTFVKVADGKTASSWGLRVKGVPRQDASPSLKTSVFFYTTLEGSGNLSVAEHNDPKGIKGLVTLHGNTPELGEFDIVISDPDDNTHPKHAHQTYRERPLDRTFVDSSVFPEDSLWQVKRIAEAIFFSRLKESVDAFVTTYGKETAVPPCQVYTLKPNAGPGNMQLVQKVFEGSFEFDILYSPKSAAERMTSLTLTSEIKSFPLSFSKKFKETFPLESPFQSQKLEQCSKSLFSNLIGGIGYFYGDYLVDSSYAEEYEEMGERFWEDAEEARRRNKAEVTSPVQLFSSIPSRTFFPRGFLWDEGFHLLPILEWDQDLALQIVKSWFELMDEDGWIAREQILGAEARSKVPSEFQVQYPHYANPPTLFFVVDALLDKINTPKYADVQNLSSGNLTLEILRTLYEPLRLHYSWIRKTQRGDVKAYGRKAFSKKEAYRWRGRSLIHILPSGLDDYPRVQPPHAGELHADLLSWVGMMTDVMIRLANVLEYGDDEAEFKSQAYAIRRNLYDLHWNESAQIHCDSTIDEWDESLHVCHKGYISLLPFMNGLLDLDSQQLEASLSLIEDPDQLWSDYGVRSLSKSDEFYHTNEDYWRGPVWVNMNYLILRRLLIIGQSSSPYRAKAAKIYGRLRINIVNTVCNSWESTGFAWEQYNPETGLGQRTQHFTGWTSLVVKIMSMPDLGSYQTEADAGSKDTTVEHEEL